MDQSLIRSDLELMLKSEFFSRSQRLSRFLRHVVEAKLEGRSDELKESLIGVSVFDRPPGYDPKQDAIVRVDARRLRSRLLEYYASAPAVSVRIELPKGSYVPEFLPVPASDEGQTQRETPLPREGAGPVRRLGLVAAITLLVVAAMAGIWWLRPAPATLSLEGMFANARTFTNLRGAALHPSFSPDGNAVAFDWGGSEGDNIDIYLQRVDGDSPVRITRHELPEIWPVWSPNGGEVAFLRADTESAEIVIRSVPGDDERVVVRFGARWGDRPRLDWSPNGAWFASAERAGPGEPQRIVVFDAATGSKRVLTTPAPKTSGDSEPAFSPDSRQVAFRRTLRPGVEDVFLVAVEGGEPRQLTADSRSVSSIAWEGNGAAVIVSSRRAGAIRQIWRFPLDGGEPQRLTQPAINAAGQTFSRQGDLVAFVQSYEDKNVYAMDPTQTESVRLVADSLALDCDPSLSPDGRSLVFRSARSGADEIWRQEPESGKVRRLTRLDGPLVGSASWSPAGDRIVFNAIANGQGLLYAVPAFGGEPQVIGKREAQHETAPRYARDGRWLYFASDKTGQSEIWRMPAGGGGAVQITAGGGVNAKESADGRILFYARPGKAAGIYSLELESKTPREGKLVAPLPGPYLGHWALSDQELFAVFPTEPGKAVLRTMEPATGKLVREIPMKGIPAAYDGGLSVSADGKTIFYSVLERAGSNLMLGEPR